MSTENLEANFIAVLSDTVPRRVTGKPVENFIVSCVLLTPLTGFEQFDVDINPYLESIAQKKKSALTDEEEIEDVNEKVPVSQ